MSKLKKKYQERSKEERKEQVKPILQKLTELNLTITMPPIKCLLEKLQEYIQEGIDIKLNIPFPSHDSNIKGELAVNKKRETWVVIRPIE